MKQWTPSSLLLVLAASVMTIAGLTACTGPKHHAPSGLAALSAASILEKVVAATSTAGPVHVNVNIRAGSRSVTYSDDSLPGSGRQVITISNGGHAVVLVLNEIGYVRANSVALRTFFGLPAEVAARFAGRWISFKQGQPGYQAVTAGVTVAGVISELRLRAPLSKLPAATTGGSLAVRIRGVAPAAREHPREQPRSSTSRPPGASCRSASRRASGTIDLL